MRLGRRNSIRLKCPPVEICIVNVAHFGYNICTGGITMNKTISMSIRVSEDELQKLKRAARLESYSSYSEFVRRTALIEAERVIRDSGENTKEENENDD